MKKHLLLFLMALFTAALPGMAYTTSVGDKYQLVTSTDDITLGDRYILCYDTYAMGSYYDGEGYFNAISNGVSINEDIAEIVNSDIVSFNITTGSTTEVYGIQISGTKYIRFNGSTLDTGNKGANADVTFSINERNSQTTIAFNNTKGYYLYYKGSAFKALSSGSTPKLYKKIAEDATPQAVTTSTATFDFSIITTTSGKDGDISFSTAKNSGTATPTVSSNALRLYYDKSKGCSLTLSGATMTKIEFTYESSSYTFPTSQVSVGSLSNSNDSGTWTGSASEVTFTNTQPNNNQVRIKKIVVTYETTGSTGGGSTDPVDPDPVDPTESATYALVKNIDEINDGAECIIVNTGLTYALSTTQNNNNRGAEAITASMKNSDGTITPNSNFEIIKIEKVSGGYTLYASAGNSKGYLYAASSSNNYLRTRETNSDKNSIATITINASTGVATITFTGTYTRNILKNNGSLFACYASGQTDIKIYKKVEPQQEKSKLTKFEYNAATAEYDLNPLVDNTLPTLAIEPEGLNLDITYKSSDETVAAVAADGTVTPLAVGTTTITATFAGNSEYKGATASYNLTVIETGETDGNMPEVGSSFRQVKSTDQLAEGYYVIARQQSGYAMNTEFDSTNNRINTTDKISVESVETGSATFNLLTTKDNDVLVVYLKNENDAWSIKTVNLGNGLSHRQGYLAAGNGTALTLSNEVTPVYFDFSSQGNANISFVKEGPTISINSGNKYFNLASGNAVQLYQFTAASKFDPQFEDVYMKLDETHTITVNAEEVPEITYNVKGNTTLIKVENGVITPARIGSATVVATWEDSENWFGGKQEFNVYVVEESNIYFTHAVVRGKQDVGVVAQAAHYNGDGHIVYSVQKAVYDAANGTIIGFEPTTDITINAETGMIRPDDIANAVIDWTYKVCADVETTQSYTSGHAEYLIIIEASEQAPVKPNSATFKFSEKGYGMYTFGSSDTSGSSEYELSKEGHEGVSRFTEETIHIDMSGDYRWFNQDHIRTYSKSTLKVSSSNGTITNVKFQFANSTQNNISVIDADLNKGETKTDNSAYSYEWVAKSPNGVSDITFTFSATSRVSYISVTSLQRNSDKPAADLCFNDEDRIINVMAGVETKLPELLHNESLTQFEDIVLDIDEINEMDDAESFQNYTIDGVDFNDIKVTVNEPGVYTFRAKYEGEKLLNGMAILRLNVFPRLSVLPDNENNLSDDERTQIPELTLISPTSNDNGSSSVVITLPTLDELNDELKYSTVKVGKITVDHNGEQTEYTGIMPETFEFTEDGSVTYTLVYANTEDFTVEETVYVVFMPDNPEVVGDATNKKATITPSKNAYLQYYIYEYTEETPEPIFPGEEDLYNDDETEAEDGLSTLAIDPSKLNVWYVTEGKDQSVVLDEIGYAIKSRSIKNLTEILPADKLPTDTILANNYSLITLDDNGTVVGVEDIAVDNANGEVEYYNLQGVRVVNAVPGNVYIVRQGNTASKVLVK